MNPADLSGFDPRVQDQLAQLALGQDPSTIYRSTQSAAQNQPHHNQYTPHSTYIHPRNMRYSQNRPGSGPAPTRGGLQTQPIPGPDAFPPLGSRPPANPANSPQRPYQQHHAQVPPDTSVHPTHAASAAARNFFSQARGRGRSHGQGPTQGFHRGRGRGQDHRPDFSAHSATNHNHNRPYPHPNHRWNNSFSSQSWDQSGEQRQRTMLKSDFLDFVAQKLMTNMLTRNEIESKHLFRQKLESLARRVYALSDPATDALQVKLQSYGSLSNSFGTSGCDVDLLLTVESKPGDYIDLTESFKRDLEKALLDESIGARLLTNTRIPIIRVCETPSATLLSDLRANRILRDAAERGSNAVPDNFQTVAPLPVLTKSQERVQAAMLAELDPTAIDVPLPQTPVLDHAKLEYIGDCGIQCDINFTNRVALHNTKMLWTYGQCDIRVRHMGIFVKNWAKARDINTPYRGTLSSYGYILMVLHYLMNIASPPVIPNLQHMARSQSWEQEPTSLFEGHDVRFSQNLNEIRQSMDSMPKNRNSLGGLLHGFFRYYTARDGFNWTQDVISIRSLGGLESKQNKGWTGAKWTGDGKNVRLRYLLAIEDPFELEHNVARTVGHNGIKAVRDELRRAMTIIENIQRVDGPQGTSWIWNTNLSNAPVDGAVFIEPVKDRGDLLKMDAEYRKEQLRSMRQQAEAEEESARKQALAGTSDDELGDTYGMSADEDFLFEIDASAEDQGRLIHDVQLQDQKVSRMRGPAPAYKTLSADEDETENDEPLQSNRPLPTNGMFDSDAIRRAASSPPHWVESSETASDDWASAKENPVISESSPIFHPVASVRLIDLGPDQDDWDDWQEETQTKFHVPQSDHVSLLDEAVEPEQAGGWQNSGAIYNNLPTDAATTAEPTVSQNHGLTSLHRTTLTPSQNTVTPSSHRDKSPATSVTSMSKHSLQPSHSVSHRQESFSHKVRDSLDIRHQNSHHNSTKVPQSLQVGRFIQWAAETAGGRWLLERDARIRDGQRVTYTAGDKGRLHAKFPYDSSMTPQDLMDKNNLLRKWYTDTLYPRLPEDVRNRNSEAAEVLIDLDNAEEDSWAGEEVNSNRPSKFNIDHIIDSGRIGDGIHWSTVTGIGCWLRWRDRRVLSGEWVPRDSLAADVSDLFPRDRNTTVGDMMRMNDELDNFFAGLNYPRRRELSRAEMDEAVAQINHAIQRTLDYRATHPQGSQEVYSFVQSEVLRAKESLEAWSAPMDNVGDSPDKQDESMQTRHLGLEPVVQSESQSFQRPTGQSKILLDMFKIENPQSPVFKTAGNHYILDPDDQQVILDRSMKAVQNLSEKLSRGQLAKTGAPSGATTDFVRAQRLAYFKNSKNGEKGSNVQTSSAEDQSKRQALDSDQQQEVPPISLPEQSFEPQYKPVPESEAETMSEQDRRETAVRDEGTWTPLDSHRPSPSQSPPRLFNLTNENLTNLQKHLRSSAQTIPSGEEQVAASPHDLHVHQVDQHHQKEQEHGLGQPLLIPIDTQNNPPSTLPDEIIPNTLRPHLYPHPHLLNSNSNAYNYSYNTQSYQRKWTDRFEDPRNLPIPRTIDYQFNIHHLMDLQDIMEGGNGCAREGWSAFRFEGAEGYTWGGGGMMATAMAWKGPIRR